MPNLSSFKNKEEYLLWYRNYRRKNIEKRRKYSRDYNKKYRKIHGYKNEYNSKIRYPEKEYARKLFTSAIKKGVLKKQNCEICGSENSQGHHDDYFKPLEVIWLCPVHHSEKHKKYKE